MGYVPPSPPAPTPFHFRAGTIECEGCGAPVHPVEYGCSYCERVPACHAPSRASAYEAMRGSWLTRNEVRAAEGLAPIEEWIDVTTLADAEPRVIPIRPEQPDWNPL